MLNQLWAVFLSSTCVNYPCSTRNLVFTFAGRPTEMGWKTGCFCKTCTRAIFWAGWVLKKHSPLSLLLIRVKKSFSIDWTCHKWMFMQIYVLFPQPVCYTLLVALSVPLLYFRAGWNMFAVPVVLLQIRLSSMHPMNEMLC